MSSLGLPAPATTGTVANQTDQPISGNAGRKVIAGDSYDQYTMTTVIGTTYFIGIYLKLGALFSGLARVMHVIDTAGEVVCSVRISSAGSLQLYDHEGNQQGNTITLDLSKAYLIDLVVKQAGAGNGTVTLRVDNEVITASLSTLLTNTKWNRLRVGINTAGVTGEVFFLVNGINDDQGGSNNSYVGGTVYPGLPATLRPSGNGRRPRRPGMTTQVNNVPFANATDRGGPRVIPNKTFRLYRFLAGFNLEGVDTNSKGEAAPAEIRNPGGTGRSGYANGNGGTILAQLVTCKGDSTPDLSNVLASEEVNAVDRYEQSKALLTPGATVPNQMLYFTFDVDVTGGKMYAVIFRNTHASPAANFFSLNCACTSLSAGGPHRLNTLSKFASGALAELDPRECVFWSVYSGAEGSWVTGEAVGGDTKASGLPADRAGGHQSAYYSGLDVSADEAVRLPWYGYLSKAGAVEGIQPYYNYLISATAPTLTCRKAGRAVTVRRAGGLAPEGQVVGVVTFTNLRTGVSGKTSALGGGFAEGLLDVPVPIEAGDTYTITCTGKVFVEQADSFQQAIFGLGGGNFPFTTSGAGAGRACLFADPWPYFAALIPMAEKSRPLSRRNRIST
jgi:hypothetical protein